VCTFGCGKVIRKLTRDRVPAADAKISQAAMDETFYLTNIAPQVGDGFNRHCKWTMSVLEYLGARTTGLLLISDWAYLEDFCRRLTTNFEDVYVFT